MGAEIKEIPYKKGPKAGEMAPARLFISRGIKPPTDTAFRLTYKTAKLVLANVGNIEKYITYCEGKVQTVAADTTKQDLLDKIVGLAKQL